MPTSIAKEQEAMVHHGIEVCHEHQCDMVCGIWYIVYGIWYMVYVHMNVGQILSGPHA